MVNINFTYQSYKELINLLEHNNYKFCNFTNENEYNESDKLVILRHDIDLSLQKAVELAQLEYDLGIKSTYFVLVSTDFYNIFSKNSLYKLNKILSLNHELGLHFDESKYDCKNEQDIKNYINKEIKILEMCLNNKVSLVSMHRPSKFILNSDIKFNHIVNCYSKKYFNEYKYLSDARMNWRENIEDIVCSNLYKKIQIVTHGIWYYQEEKSINDVVKIYIKNKQKKLIDSLSKNIRNFEKINYSD